VISSLILYDPSTLSFTVIPVAEAEDEDIIENSSSLASYLFNGLLRNVMGYMLSPFRRSQESSSKMVSLEN